MKTLTALVVYMSLTITVQQVRADLRACAAATVRVSWSEGSSRHIGTGITYLNRRGRLYVLTNCHVVSRRAGPSGQGPLAIAPAGKPINVEFWSDSTQRFSVRGRVEACSFQENRNRDLAIVSVATQDCEGRAPKPVPLGAKRLEIKPGERFLTIGCAHGETPTAVYGQIVRVTQTKLICSPNFAQGRSGSPVFDASGQMVIGIIFGQGVDNPYGHAMNLAEIVRAFEGEGPGIDSYNESAIAEAQYVDELPLVLINPYEIQCRGGRCRGMPMQPRYQPQLVPRQSYPQRAPRREQQSAPQDFRPFSPWADDGGDDGENALPGPKLEEFKIGPNPQRSPSADLKPLYDKLSELEKQIGSLKGCQCQGGCKCDLAKLQAEFDARIKELSAGLEGKLGMAGKDATSKLVGLELAIAALSKTVAAGGCKCAPPAPTAKQRHVVIVANQSAPNWYRLKDEIDRAKHSYSGIRIADPPPFSVVLPQIVCYQDGIPVKEIVGSRAVSEALSHVARGESDFFEGVK